MKNKIYVKIFKLSNSDGTFTQEEFELFKEKFKVIEQLYFNGGLRKACFIDFSIIVKEIKRAAHKANLSSIYLHDVTYSSYENEIIISGEQVSEANVIVGIKRVEELKKEYFYVPFITMIEPWKVKDATVLSIKYNYLTTITEIASKV